MLIDEVDLHLHAIHQYEVLPSLIRLFPKVQFIVTTHSPLFVLGMNETVGENGFAIYRMPEGNPDQRRGIFRVWRCVSCIRHHQQIREMM